MSYTEDELHKAEQAYADHWRAEHWRAKKVAQVVLDAVLPDHDRQLRRQTLVEALGEVEDSLDAYEAEGRVRALLTIQSPTTGSPQSP